MKTPHGCLTAALAGIVCCLAATAGLPILASGITDSSPNGACTPGQLTGSTDGSPSILGQSALTGEHLTAWWHETRRSQPRRLDVPVDDLIAMYLAEGHTEGVRGDIALAQAIHETGYFTSSDTSRNNFAGMAHPDGASSGRAFPDPRTGVRAHIQLLKKFATGNDVDLAHADVAPNAGASARTWSELAGTWATDPDYWTAISRIYDGMVRLAGRTDATSPADGTSTCEPPSPTPSPASVDGQLADVQGIVVHNSIAQQLENLLAAAEADGLTLTGTGYRSHQRQIELRRAHCGTSNYAIYEMPSSQCSPPTARPGSSMHEQGLAVDFVNCSSHSTACWQWLNANGATYGFFNLASEPWHWSTTAT